MATPPKLCGDCGNQMDPVDELFALMGMTHTPNGLAFNSNRAYPVTVYVCNNCGRLKMMSAALLGNLVPQEEAVMAMSQQGIAGQGMTGNGEQNGNAGDNTGSGSIH